MKEKSIPLWLKISHQIEQDFTDGQYKDADMLPTEVELCDVYEASRITIRGAMARLVEQNKIRRIKGKGTIINRKYLEEANSRISSFTTEMHNKGSIPSTSYVTLERRCATQYISELFGVDRTVEFYVLERVRCVNDVPLCHFVTYLPIDIGLSQDVNDYYGSLYEMLGKQLNLKIDFTQQALSAEIPEKKTKELLNLLSGEPVLLIKRWAYHKDRLIEFSICRYDSKRYECKFEEQNI